MAELPFNKAASGSVCAFPGFMHAFGLFLYYFEFISVKRIKLIYVSDRGGFFQGTYAPQTAAEF